MTILVAKQLTIAQGKRHLYVDISFSIAPGERWGILGQNGSGKSTLLHTLIGLHPLQKGKILLDGGRLQAIPRKIRARKIGILLQENGLHHHTATQTIYDYCALSRFPHRAFWGKLSQADHAAITMALDALALLPIAARPLQQLSGGEKRRLCFAALLAQDPAIYLLDEPTNHLDMASQVRVMQVIKKISREEKTCFIATHDVNLVVNHCSHVILLMPNGQWLQGPVDSLLTEANLNALYQCAMQQQMAWHIVDKSC